MSLSITKDVTTIKHFDTGYVRVDASGRQFAQMPLAVWDAMEPGETVPDEWAFEPEWCRLRKANKCFHSLSVENQTSSRS